MSLSCNAAAPLTRRIRYISPSWRPSTRKTSDDLQQWSTCLRAIGIKLAVVSVCSLACKAVLVALHFFGVTSGGSSLSLCLSMLLVEALPSMVAITLLIRYYSGSFGRRSDISVSLLHRAAGDGSVSEAAARQLQHGEHSFVGAAARA